MRSLAGRLFAERKGAWSGPLGSLLGEWLRSDDSGTHAATAEQAMRVAAVATCVRLIAQTVASLPLHMYERRADGGRERVPVGNTLERILQRPNEWQTGFQFREQLTADLLMEGDALAWINWTKALDQTERILIDRVVELIPLDPRKVQIERPKWNQPPRYYVYQEQGDKVELPRDEVLHVPGLSFDGTRGRGILRDARETLSVALSTQEYARKFWAHDAQPGVVITTDQRLNPDQAEQIADQYDERHAGAKNARRTAVLGFGSKLTPTTLNAEDSQFLETRKFQRSEIAGLFLVPPHMIGDVDRSTSWGTGIEQQQIGFLTYTIRPWLIRWEQAISKCLINLEDRYYVEHNVAGMLRGDVRSQMAAFATGINWGIWSPNDCRRMLNENPRDNGDVYLQPVNMVASGSNPAEAALQADARAQAGGGNE